MKVREGWGKKYELRQKQTWPYGRQTPDNNLMRFMERFPFDSYLLDIGSGEGANARELIIRGHAVISLDLNPDVPAPVSPVWHKCVDVRDFEHEGGRFDCIYDINTLCHVEDPPFKKIKNWLKPNGFFFSICPQFGSCSRIMEGKDFTRFLPLKEVEKFYGEVFGVVIIGSTTYRLPGDEMYASWIVEARP